MKTIISKELFVKSMNELQAHEEQNRKRGENLSELFDADVSFDNPNIVRTVLNLLDGDFEHIYQKDMISYFAGPSIEYGTLYKKGDKDIYGEDTDLSNASALYDFLIEQNKKPTLFEGIHY